MIQTTKIAKNLVGVTYNAKEILLRESGKEHFGYEKPVVTVKPTRIVINMAVAEKFGLTVEII
ncbi:hypothetical protein [Lachnospira multipara]|uniref:hypothetical protein n=1 Tax=Lachnospira multipara TaxID=28051 RepID=UPI000482DB26|nr:hypothetical protein [Lachnospira multipara]